MCQLTEPGRAVSHSAFLFSEFFSGLGEARPHQGEPSAALRLRVPVFLPFGNALLHTQAAVLQNIWILIPVGMHCHPVLLIYFTV